jgi:hypothetical protein
MQSETVTKISFGEKLISHLINVSDITEEIKNSIREFEKTEWKLHADAREKNKDILGFGKYKGKNINDVFKLDPQYCKWLHEKSQKFLTESVKLSLIELMK